jgi:hypothetical protein
MFYKARQLPQYCFWPAAFIAACHFASEFVGTGLPSVLSDIVTVVSAQFRYSTGRSDAALTTPPIEIITVCKPVPVVSGTTAFT